jgi:hypothetical protein
LKGNLPERASRILILYRTFGTVPEPNPFSSFAFKLRFVVPCVAKWYFRNELKNNSVAVVVLCGND